MSMNRREPCILLQWFVPEVQCRRSPNASLLIEQLRAAGIVSVVRDTCGEDGEHFMLQICCPKGPYDTRQWAEMNASRMRSFGLNAQASWRE